ncbi:uncharacterized protein At1g26090, chloroplastic-like [Mercurialis annua]|uniref:uncharacterized protein At1g26090, chloroplastic-like n=1 Tax=Mercurialis annua TaxID=3986 RepID=UPI0024AE9413|nr:uncharacterized protein At1g26090, chloroplastic-like [Mercurialis annua]
MQQAPPQLLTDYCAFFVNEFSDFHKFEASPARFKIRHRFYEKPSHMHVDSRPNQLLQERLFINRVLLLFLTELFIFGKTFTNQHYAMAGLNICLVIQTQDRSADYLFNCKIETSPVVCNDNLSAVRSETTKMLLESLNKLKHADARLKMNQGVLEGVVGEDLGILPALDFIFSAFVLERLVGFLKNATKGKDKEDEKFDIIIYDGFSTDETLRMIGAASKARFYLKYLRNLAEKTYLGRLAGPSLLRLVDEAIGISDKRSLLNEKMSAEIWCNIP